MNEKIKNGLALVLAFFVGYAPAAWAVDVHIFRNPTTLVPVGASVDDAGKFQGDGSDLTNLPSSAHGNGANCAANQFNKGVDANGAAESCATLLDADVPDSITVTLAGTATALAANGANCSAGNAPLGVNASGVVEGCFDVTTQSELTTHTGIDDAHFDHADNLVELNSQITSAIVTGPHTSAGHSDGANCSVNQFNKGVDANGAAQSCATLLDADIPNTITITLAATATALAANPSDCAVNTYANTIAADGDLTCSSIIDADVPNNITITLAATATALAADPSDCSAGEFSAGINASGVAQGCTDVLTQSEASSGFQPLDTELTNLGAHYQNKAAQSVICTTVPTATGNFMTQSDSPYQIWTSTGTAIGQWIGMFNGLGPC